MCMSRAAASFTTVIPAKAGIYPTQPYGNQPRLGRISACAGMTRSRDSYGRGWPDQRGSDATAPGERFTNS